VLNAERELGVRVRRNRDSLRAFLPDSFHTGDIKTREIITMKAIVVTDQAAGTAGMKLVERP